MSKSKKARKKKTGSRYNVDAHAFVVAWSSSNTVEEVMKKTGMPKNAVYSRVNSYRSKKVDLKYMPRTRKTMDIQALTALAKKTATSHKD